jgi:hypothetical protein
MMGPGRMTVGGMSILRASTNLGNLDIRKSANIEASSPKFGERKNSTAAQNRFTTQAITRNPFGTAN